MLWTNPTPATLAAGKITLDLSAYQGVRIEAWVSDDLKNIAVSECPIGTSSNITYLNVDTARTGTNAINYLTRNYEVDSTGITFESANMIHNATVYKSWDGRAIPYRIYGVKYTN